MAKSFDKANDAERVAKGVGSALGESTPEELRSAIAKYAAHPLFAMAESDEVYVRENPFRRPCRPQDIPHLDFSKPLARNQLLTNSSLAAHRLLTNIYESDLVFLPSPKAPRAWEDFRSFYADDYKVLGERVRPALERHVFGFLGGIELPDVRSGADLLGYLNAWPAECEKTESSLLRAVGSARSPELAARTFLAQMAGDFLSEASAMARNVLGNYGPALSNLFRIFNDEYGKGNHSRKHSTLYEDTLKSVGMFDNVHAYWQFYLPSSLALINYFHYVSRDHSRFLRYVGALVCTEVALVSFCRRTSQVLRSTFGSSVDTRYFDVHECVDKYHSTVAINDIVAPLLDAYGDAVVPEILAGFEEFKVLQDIADRDLIDQIRWGDDIDGQRVRAELIMAKLRDAQIDYRQDTFLEPNGERSTTHVHEEDRLLVIERGTMHFWPTLAEPLELREGSMLFIPAGRLHGSVVRSTECLYHQPVVEPGRFL